MWYKTLYSLCFYLQNSSGDIITSALAVAKDSSASWCGRGDAVKPVDGKSQAGQLSCLSHV